MLSEAFNHLRSRSIKMYVAVYSIKVKLEAVGSYEEKASYSILKA